jgi:hypothetical protein
MNNIHVIFLNVKLELYLISHCVRFFEINEGSLSDTRCMIQDVASPHCGDEKNGATLTNVK